MLRTRLWTVGKDTSGSITAVPVDTLDSTETESKLEELLVASPSLLSEDLTIVGRQTPTAGGYMDLLGVDQDGRIVIFELKRGTLTREAVAQILDYASDLNDRELSDVARLVEENSGKLGIEQIDDFLDWYDREYPNGRDELAKTPRMVLVGLGVDDRARRMVDFLARGGLEIQLLTFHAFSQDGSILLARQVETVPTGKKPDNASATKEGNRRILLDAAASLGCRDLLEEVASFISTRLHAYQWPGRTAYSFSLQSRTSEGKPTMRSAIALYINQREPRSVLLRLTQRAKDAAGPAVMPLQKAVGATIRSDAGMFAVELKITSELWPRYRVHLEALIEAISDGWKRTVDRTDAEVISEADGSV